MNLRTTFLLLAPRRRRRRACGTSTTPSPPASATPARRPATPRRRRWTSSRRHASGPSRQPHRGHVHDGEPVDLDRTGKAWSLPGGWPTRGPEVAGARRLLAGLASRFDADPGRRRAPTCSPTASTPTQKPVRVDVTVEFPGPEKSKTLPPALRRAARPRPATRSPGRPTSASKASRKSSACRRACSPCSRRPPDAYQKRQLFPEVERVRLADARPNFPGDPTPPPPPAALVDARSVSVTGPDGAWRSSGHAARPPSRRNRRTELTAERLAARWELTEPVADRVDPEKLKGVLAAVPELWVEASSPTPTRPRPASTSRSGR